MLELSRVASAEKIAVKIKGDEFSYSEPYIFISKKGIDMVAREIRKAKGN